MRLFHTRTVTCGKLYCVCVCVTLLPQVMHSTTIKIMTVIIDHCFILCSLIWCVIAIFVGRKKRNKGKVRKKETNKQTNCEV